MLGIEITIADFLVEGVTEKRFIGDLELMVREKYGLTAKIVVLANKSEANQDRLWVKGTIYPECDGETEMSDEYYNEVLMQVGLAVEKKQKRFLEMEIFTGVVFAGIKYADSFRRPKGFIEEGPHPLPK